jgi:hypothetical protein
MESILGLLKRFKKIRALIYTTEMAEPEQINRLTTDHKSVRDRRPTETLTLDTDDIMDCAGLAEKDKKFAKDR